MSMHEFIRTATPGLATIASAQREELRTSMRSSLVAAMAMLATSCAGAASDDLSELALVGWERVSDVDVHSAAPFRVAGAEAELRLGAATGAPAQQFSRIAHAGRLSDGRLVVADGGSRELRYFDLDGTLLLRVGGRGGGPGEFQSFTHIHHLPSDTLVVFDRTLRRITRIDPEGSIAEIVSFEAYIRFGSNLPTMERQLVAALAGGRFALAFTDDPAGTIDAVADGDTLRILDSLVITSPGGEEADTIAMLPGILRRMRFQVMSSPAGGIPLRNPEPFPTQLAGAVLVTGAHDRIIVSRTDRYELGIYNASGHPELLIRRTDIEPRRLTREVLNRFDDAFYQVITSPRDGARDVLIGSALPTHSAILVDRIGNIWVRDPDPPFPWFAEEYMPSNDYTVFTREGRLAARARLPAGVNVHQVDPDYVVGVVRDELEVEYVVVYAIREADAPAGDL
jgi:hypothetical protein